MARATLTDVITMACARALREHPGVNSSFSEDCVIVHERVNIGLALALDDGLTVPVILDADARSLDGARGGAPAARRGGTHAWTACGGDLRRDVQHLQPRPARRRPLPGARAPAAGRDPGRRLARATPSASRRPSITAPSTAHPARASSRRSRGCSQSRPGPSRPDGLSRRGRVSRGGRAAAEPRGADRARGAGARAGRWPRSVRPRTLRRDRCGRPRRAGCARGSGA